MDHRRADFDRFVSDNTDGLLRTAFLIVWDLPEAEDLVQETLLKVARRWPRVRRTKHPVAYARRILVNLALDGAARRSRNRLELTGGEPDDRLDRTDGCGDGNAVECNDELRRALTQLPPRQRSVIVLRYYLDLPEAEVAAALECSLGTVKSTASRGLARLEQTLRNANDTRSIPT